MLDHRGAYLTSASQESLHAEQRQRPAQHLHAWEEVGQDICPLRPLNLLGGGEMLWWEGLRNANKGDDAREKMDWE